MTPPPHQMPNLGNLDAVQMLHLFRALILFIVTMFMGQRAADWLERRYMEANGIPTSLEEIIETR